MALWGISDSDESKPKNLTAAEKKEVFANASGWVREAGSPLSGNGNVNADPELLVAVSGLAVKLGSADITEIEFITTAFDKSEGGTLQVRVRFNEAVDVTGTPQLTVVNDTNANHTLSYASGTGTVSSAVRRQLRRQLRRQFRRQLRRELWRQLRRQLRQQLCKFMGLGANH